MRRRITGVILGFLTILTVSAPAGAADLALTIGGIANDKGYVMIALFDKPAGFRKTEAAVAAIRVRARKGDVKVTLFDLPSGTYAVSSFHDENGDQKLDRNMMNIPTEGYGFSNGARGVMGPPSFEDSAFKAGDGVKTVPIEIGY